LFWLSTGSQDPASIAGCVLSTVRRSAITGSEEVRREILRRKEKAAAEAAAFYIKPKLT